MTLVQASAGEEAAGGDRSRKKKVLIIANLFHATPRITRFVRHFPSHGWYATIITPVIEPGLKDLLNAPPADIKDYGIRIIETGESHPYEKARQGDPFAGRMGRMRGLVNKVDPRSDSRLRALVEKYYWRCYHTLHYPDVEKGWRPQALAAAEALLEKERFDVMLSSSSPIIAHVICAELRRKHRVPWIAEYRDLWTQNHNYPLGPVMKMFDRRLERRTVGAADAIVTNTDMMKEDLEKLFPPSKCFTVTTGYEREDYAVEAPLTRDFTITYTGQIYRAGQDPNLLIDAVAELINEKKMGRERVKIRFYGPEDYLLETRAEEAGLKGVLSQNGVVSKREAIVRQKESQLLLCMNWASSKGARVQLIKFVDYLATGRPMLVTGGVEPSYLVDGVRRTGAGSYSRTKEELKVALEGYYNEYLTKGAVQPRGDPAEIEKLDIRNTARKYAELMDRLSAGAI